MSFVRDIMFYGLENKMITRDRIKEFIQDSGVKRIHFATTHSNALRKGEDGMLLRFVQN